MFTMAGFPFDRVVGVELSQDLINCAISNAARLKSQNLYFFCCDATEFTNLDEFTHAYMFNPFPAEIVRRVIHNLDVSLTRNPRDFTLIYKYPGSPDAIITSRFLKKAYVFESPLSHPFHIYAHREPTGT